ncbi:hypothetical protein AB0M05_27805 [Streptomyces violaceusniger]|uniref:hypothetical protein n=1 Tax=Streptomyces violaceusniger TaxID=68280 RepID=UPI00343C920B
MTVLVMQADASFWHSLVFDGIDDMDVEAVTAAFGTVEVVARGRRPALRARGLRSLLGPFARLLSAQVEESSARWAERCDPADGPAFHLRHGGFELEQDEDGTGQYSESRPHYLGES